MQTVVTARRAPRMRNLDCAAGRFRVGFMFTPLRALAIAGAGALDRPAASIGLRWPRCSCRSLGTNSWRRRCSSRSRSLTLIWRASREERKALVSAKTASPAHGAGPRGAMRGDDGLHLLRVERTSRELRRHPWSLPDASPFPNFPRHRTRMPRECSEVARGGDRPKRRRHRTSVGLAPDKPRRGVVLGVVPAQWH